MMTHRDSKTPARTAAPFRRRGAFRRHQVRFWFLVVILIAIPVSAWFVLRDATPLRFTGLVDSESETVGSVDTARILSVEVKPGQGVRAGDVLVRLDCTERALDLATQEARAAEYEQTLLRQRQALQETARRGRQLAHEARVALEEQRMNRARDEAELAGLRAEMVRLQPLVEKRIAGDLELTSLRSKAEALDRTIPRYEPLLAALQRRSEQADRDADEATAALAAAQDPVSEDPVLKSMRRLTGAYRSAMGDEPSVLRASRTGVISRVMRRPGDVVLAGEPIVRVASTQAPYVTGMLAQGQLTGLAVGTPMRIYRMGTARHPPVMARVESIDPEVMDLIDPFNPAPRFPIRGRQVRLRILSENSSLMPGETVTVEAAAHDSWLARLRRYRWIPWSRPSALYAAP